MCYHATCFYDGHSLRLNVKQFYEKEVTSIWCENPVQTESM